MTISIPASIRKPKGMRVRPMLVGREAGEDVLLGVEVTHCPSNSDLSTKQIFSI